MIKDGIIIIDKEQNMTSHDVVGRVRRIFGVKRVGHTGTLDPMATGVLPVCVGRAARVIQFLECDMKKYRCEMTLGIRSNTYDIWGKPVDDEMNGLTDTDSDGERGNAMDACLKKEERSVGTDEGNNRGDSLGDITLDMVTQVLKSFEGKIVQSPPIYSAVKVNGKRLYEYARKGRDVEIPKREVYIKGIDIISCYGFDRSSTPHSDGAHLDEFSDPGDDHGASFDKDRSPRVIFDIECSKGTFVRSICHDAGEKLGCGAVMSALERVSTGAFDIEHAVTLSELERMTEEERREVMLDPCDVMNDLGIAYVDAKDAVRLINGLEIEPACYEIEKEPKYKTLTHPLGVRDEFRRMYRIYSDLPDDMEIPGRPGGSYEELHVREDRRRFIGVGLLSESNTESADGHNVEIDDVGLLNGCGAIIESDPVRSESCKGDHAVCNVHMDASKADVHMARDRTAKTKGITAGARHMMPMKIFI